MNDAPEIENLSGGAVDDVPAVRLDPSAATAGRRDVRKRRLAYCLAGSVLFHLAVAAILFISPAGRSLATRLAGLKADGPSSYGSSRQESPTGSTGAKNPDAISVTLTPPSPSGKAQPKTTANKPAPAAREPTPPVPEAPAEEPHKRPDGRAQRPNVLAAKGKEKGTDATAPKQVENPVPRPEAAQPGRQPPAKSVPVPAPRPRRMATATPKAGEKAPDGSLYGILGGRRTAPARAAQEGGKAEGAGADAVSNYPGTIAGKLNASLRYPAEARSKGLSGEARVQFIVEASGRIGAVRVLTSSGSELLDEAAIATVKRAAPFPPIPAAANRRRWPFSVSLAFGK